MQELLNIYKIKKIELECALYVVATPIGNLKDITIRALEVLNSCNYIFCEDTRVSGKLLKKYNIEHSRLKVYNDYSDDSQREYIINLVKDGNSVAIITDAGTPTISDPGYKLINRCIENIIKIIPIPGCSACITAMSASGIGSDKFLFYGFLPASKTQKENELESLLSRNETIICYESPMRLINTLKTIQRIDRDRIICIAKELTKIFEEIKNDTVTNLIDYYQSNPDKIKGEFVIIIEKCKSNKELDLNNIDPMLMESLNYLSLKNSAEFFSKVLNLNRKDIYNKLLIFRQKNG